MDNITDEEFAKFKDCWSRIENGYERRCLPAWTEEDESQLNRDLIAIEWHKQNIHAYGSPEQRKEMIRLMGLEKKKYKIRKRKT